MGQDSVFWVWKGYPSLTSETFGRLAGMVINMIGLERPSNWVRELDFCGIECYNDIASLLGV